MLGDEADEAAGASLLMVQYTIDDDNEDDDERQPLPRHHSYLPGDLQPIAGNLHGKEDEDDERQSRNSGTRGMILDDFPILELPNIILFPGATLPIRLTERLWVEYLSREIRNRNMSTTISAPTTSTSIRLGILCHDPHIQSDPHSSPRQQQQPPRQRRRRRFWFRRTFGPTRLQRLSMQLLQELGGDAFHDLEEDNDDADDADVSDIANDTHDNGEPALALANQRAPYQHHRTATIRQPSSASSSSSSSSLSLSQQAVADRNQQRQIRRRQRRQEHQQWRQRQLQQQQDGPSRYMGRVGTIATVLFVHGPENLQERIITTYGSGRFQIIAKASSAVPEMGIPRFRVQEIPDEIWKFPSFPRYSNITSCQKQASSVSFPHKPLLRYLSQVSSVPHPIIYSYWPWKLMAEIRNILKTTPWLQALDEAISTTSNSNHNDQNDSIDLPILHDPVRFSFWMAQNLPIPQSEKLALFETIGIVERLQWILEILSEDQSEEAVMHCRNCLTPLARARDLFTVGGAEGTSGNYVNEYGCVHQTITLRSMDENEVWYQGRPEIRDSWFPGYSWTIMNCSVCGHHLGWKFRRLFGRTTSTTESLHRPTQFFGVSAANVTTFVPSQHSFEEEEEEL